MARRVANAAPWVLLAVALVAGAWLRFDALPRGDLYGDEAEYALVARGLRDDPWHPRYSLDGARVVPFVSQPPLVLYVTAGASVVLGEDSVRLVGAAFGLLGVLAAFLLGREAYDAWSGAAAASFVAIAPLHVDLSRSLFLDVPLATLVILAAWALLRWIRVGTWTTALAAGALTACAVLAKLPGVLAPAAFALFLGAQAVRERVAAGSWTEARERGGVMGALGRRRGALQAAAGLALFLLLVGAYAALVVGSGSGDAWISKMRWQAGRVTGETEIGPAPWTVYVTGSSSLPERLGIGLFALGCIGLAHAIVRWCVPRARAEDGARSPLAGDALLIAWTLLAGAFFIASARKVWFYPLPLVPGLLVLAGRSTVAASRGAWNLRPDPERTGRRVHPRSVAVALLVAILAFQVAAPAWSASTQKKDLQDSDWGDGFTDACRAMVAARQDEDEDEEKEEEKEEKEAVLGSLLGRYAMRNACPDLAVIDRFRREDLTWSDVAQGRIRWIVPDPYYEDPADAALFDALLRTFPHARVANAGPLDVVEFRPSNLTIRVERVPPDDAGDPSSRFDVTVANPTDATVDLTDLTLHAGIYGGGTSGWPWRVWNATVEREGRVLAPGESFTTSFTWSGRTYWREPNDVEGGWYVAMVAAAGEKGRSAPWLVPD